MIAIRELAERAELQEAVGLQKQIWGFEEIDLLPLRLFVVATKIGGQVLGAFDGERMTGFALAIPGLKPGGAHYLHSHMMGVLPDYRDRGTGRALKLRQRSAALERGIELIEWTFDPLELKNAFFNIERLGTVVRRYVLNQYGATSSHLHGALPTDRCVAEWHLASERVRRVLEGDGRQGHRIAARIPVPYAIADLRHGNPERAREIQAEVSRAFETYFGEGLAVLAFERGGEHGTYCLGPWPSE